MYTHVSFMMVFPALYRLLQILMRRIGLAEGFWAARALRGIYCSMEPVLAVSDVSNLHRHSSLGFGTSVRQPVVRQRLLAGTVLSGSELSTLSNMFIRVHTTEKCKPYRQPEYLGMMFLKALVKKISTYPKTLRIEAFELPSPK